jgi:iron complex outermembrane receptor protein
LNNYGSRPIAAFLVFCATIALIPGSQAADPGPASDLEEIVVTAQRREQSISDVPQSLQAFSGDYMKAASMKSIGDTMDMIPSASQVSSISVASTVYQIRAIPPSENSGDATVGYYIDNFPFALTALPYAPVVDYFDLERVEVLRGPSGTLYGLGSLGGTIKTITKEPNLDRVEGAFKVSGAWSDDADTSSSADLMFNAPLVDGKLAVRGVVSWRDRGGYAEIIPYNEENGNGAKRTSSRIQLLASPSEDLTLKFAWWNSRSRQDYLDRVTFADPPRIDNTDGTGNSDYDIYVADIEYDLGFALLRSTTGYMENKIRDNNDGCIALPVGCFESQIPNDSESINQDLRISGSAMDSSLNYIAGVFYQDSETEGGQDVLLPGNTQVPGNLGLEVANNNITSSKSWAIYGEGTYTFADVPVDLIIGLRYFSEKRTFDQNSSLRLTSLGVFLPTVGLSGYDKSTVNPRINLSWRPTPDGMLYIGATKGFRSGAINSTAQVDAANAALGSNFSPTNDPDELWNYEIGMKWTLFNGALDLNAAVYRIDWSDAQVAISPAAQFIVVPMGDVEGTGLDLELLWRTPLEGLTIALSGNVNNTELQNVDPLIQASTAARLVYMKNGNQLVGTVKDTFATVINYARPQPVFEDWMLNFNVRFNYRGEQQSSYDGRYTPSIAQGSVRLSIANERYEVELFSDNFTNETDPLSVPGGQHVVPFPRTVGLGLQVRF